MNKEPRDLTPLEIQILAVAYALEGELGWKKIRIKVISGVDEIKNNNNMQIG